MRFLIVLSLALGLALPLRADEVLARDVAPEPGAVALYLQARGLADLGARGQDPLMVLAAARILHGLEVVDSKLLPEPTPAQALPVTGPDAAALLDLARMIDAGQVYADMIDTLARETPPAPRRLRAAASSLPPGAEEVWTLPIFGGASAELAVLAQGSPSLEVVVTGPGDTQICAKRGNAAAAYCGFALLENGEVTVTVVNRGAGDAPYLMLME